MLRARGALLLRLRHLFLEGQADVLVNVSVYHALFYFLGVVVKLQFLVTDRVLFIFEQLVEAFDNFQGGTASCQFLFLVLLTGRTGRAPMVHRVVVDVHVVHCQLAFIVVEVNVLVSSGLQLRESSSFRQDGQVLLITKEGPTVKLFKLCEGVLALQILRLRRSWFFRYFWLPLLNDWRVEEFLLHFQQFLLL